MKLRKLAHGAVTMLVVAGSAAGCGGGGDEKTVATTPASSGPLTKTQFVAAADKVCKATSDKITKAASRLRTAAEKTGTIPVAQVSRFLTNTSLPAYDAMLDELRALQPPKADEKEIDGLIASLAGAIDTAKADPVKYSKNSAPDPFDDANARAVKYGMKVCGS
jgi:hypothetical protein